jgi:hypothetical protein
MNNVIFYLNNNFVIEKKTASVSNKQLVFNSTGLLGMSINNVNNAMANIIPPFLPNVGPEVYTLVLDLDETLVHFFFVISFFILDSIWGYIFN